MTVERDTDSTFALLMVPPDDWLDEICAAADVPAAAACRFDARAGEPCSWARASAGAGPAGADAVFAACSLSKAPFVLVLAQLALERVLDLDAPLARLLPPGELEVCRETASGTPSIAPPKRRRRAVVERERRPERVHGKSPSPETTRHRRRPADARPPSPGARRSVAHAGAASRSAPPRPPDRPTRADGPPDALRAVAARVAASAGGRAHADHVARSVVLLYMT